MPAHSRRPRGFGVLASVLVLALFLVATARADDPAKSARVVLLGKSPDERLLNRVGAELVSLGFQVDSVRDDDTITTANQMEALAQTESALAAVRVVVSDSAVDVWIVNRITHEMVLRRVTTGKDPAVAALRTVEVLRTSLIDLRALVPQPPDTPGPPRTGSNPAPGSSASAPAPSTPPPAPPPPVAQPPVDGSTPPDAPSVTNLFPSPFGKARFALALELAGTAATGGGGLSSHAVLVTRLMVSPQWGAQLVGIAPLTSQKVEGSEGYARLTFGLAGIGAHWQARVERPGFSVGAGIAALFLHTQGVGAAGYRGTASNTVAASPYARAGYGFALAPSWVLRTDMLVGVAMPKPVIVFADRTVSNWGRPWFAAGVGLEFVVN